MKPEHLVIPYDVRKNIKGMRMDRPLNDSVTLTNTILYVPDESEQGKVNAYFRANKEVHYKEGIAYALIKDKKVYATDDGPAWLGYYVLVNDLTKNLDMLKKEYEDSLRNGDIFMARMKYAAALSVVQKT